ncbi:MAG: DUF4403 family protein, partial [Cytophagales bacterium]|nr:DUF4403 family protein [Cytophagales bacterium]
MKKNIVLWLVMIFFIWSCQPKLTQTITHTAKYAKVFSVAKPRNFLVSVFVSYDSLSKWVDQRPDKTIFESKSDQSFIGFPIMSSLSGQVKFSTNNSNHLLIRAPAIFEAKPNVAGFNAGTVRGKLDLNVDLDVQLKSLNKFDVGNISYTYQWVEKPMVKVAGFGVNVGPIVDNLFKSKYNEVNATIKSSVEGLLQPASLEKMLVNNAQNIRWPEYVFPTSHVGLGIRKLDFSTKGINLELLLNASIGLSTTQLDKKKLVRYYLNTDQKIGRELPLSGQLDWLMINVYINKLAQEKLKNPRVKIHINGEGKDYMHAQINGFKGSKSELLIDFVPVIFEQNQIGFQIIHQELKGLSFPNSLFKNHAFKRINRLANDLKFDLLKSKELLSNFSGPLMLNNANLGIDVIQWNESGFYVSGFLG